MKGNDQFQDPQVLFLHKIPARVSQPGSQMRMALGKKIVSEKALFLQKPPNPSPQTETPGAPATNGAGNEDGGTINKSFIGKWEPIFGYQL